MKKKEINSLEMIQGGGAIGSFCAGFGAVAVVYEAGVLANFWNPIGWGAAVAGVSIAAGCAAYAIAS